jgi:hypothetical protein
MYYDASQNLMNIFSYGNLRFNVGTGNLSGAIANERMVITQAGNIGIGTAAPATRLHVLQSSYNYQDSIVESALPSVRLVDSENGQSSFGFLADGSNLYLDAYTYANRFASSYGTHMMTVQSDGKIVINDGGQLCIGTACANSATWNSIISGASGGGTGISSDFFVIPTPGFSACDYDDGCGSSIDISFDPSSNRLVAMSYGSSGDGHNRAIVDMDDLSVRNDSYNYAWALWSGACVGDWCCNIDNLSVDNFDASGALIYCQNLSSGATVNWCPDSDPWCTGHPLLGSGVINDWQSPLFLRSDGTYLYAIYSNGYAWKLDLGSMTIVDRGSGMSLPSVNGVPLRNLGTRFPYKNKIYEAKMIPDYSRLTGRVMPFIVGYSSLWIREVGSY